jgi:hypothetical protein
VLRSWSAVMKLQRKLGHKGAPTEQDAIRYARSDGISKRSNYFDCIERLERVFPRDQIYYGFFEQLAEAPAELVGDILEFVGAEPGDVKSLLPRGPVNVAAAGRKPPPEFARALAEDFLPWVRKLCQRFDGPPHRWREGYEALLSRRAPSHEVAE